jgi:hypothetical protein
MSDAKTRSRPAPAYEADFYAWTRDQAARLREARPNSIDWENVAEEIESVGRSQRSEIRKRLTVLLVHLLKWEFQPERRSASWQTTISTQRIDIESVIEDSPSLRNFPSRIADRTYGHARERAALETKLPLNTFPQALPYSIKDILDFRFMPGRDWSADDLLDD